MLFYSKGCGSEIDDVQPGLKISCNKIWNETFIQWILITWERDFIFLLKHNLKCNSFQERSQHFPKIINDLMILIEPKSLSV